MSERVTTIWLARHGEVHNPSSILYGRLPRMRLSLEGQRQARALAEFLSERPVTAIYASPMLRARRTAEALLEHKPGLRVQIDRGLIEVKTGWQGRPLAELEAVDWDFYDNPFDPMDDTVEGIRDRVFGWFQRVLRRHSGEEVVGVSHGDPILISTAALRGVPMRMDAIRPEVYIPTACVFRLRFDAEGRHIDQRMFVPHQQSTEEVAA